MQESIFDLLMAGVVGVGQPEPLWTFTIVTTAASSSFAWLHDRQPVILTSQDALDHWLDTSTQTWDPKLSRLLGSYNDSDTPLEWCAP
jgi:putative SOS response-associated peptidase YedK